MRKKVQIVCARCGLRFLADSGNRKWCDNCIAIVHREQQQEKHKRRMEKKKGIVTVAPRITTKPKRSIEAVIAYCKEYERRTGKWLDYGDAVVMLEKEENEGK